ASRELESAYWRQSDPIGLALYKALENDKTPLARDVRHYLFINGSRWDLVRENQPFVGEQLMPPGHYLYPKDLTRAALDAYVASHPKDKETLYNPFTVVRAVGETLDARSYHVEYAPFVFKAARALQQAASLSTDPAFAKFLQLRADALMTDDYY